MTVMAGGEDLLDGHASPLPGGTLGPETLDLRSPGVSVLRYGGNQMGNRLAMTRDRNALTAFHSAQELGKVSLGFGCLHTAHLKLNRLI